MFVPLRCPNPACVDHRAPRRGFHRRCGRYRARCRPGWTQRFRCRGCGRTFSEQTFRQDYRDRRPETNLQVMQMLVAGSGLRQIGRTVRLDPRAVLRKLEKYGRQLRRLHDNLGARLPAERTYLLDEEETYECASIRPLTVPLAIEARTWFVVDWSVGPIRRLAKPGSIRRRRQDADERRVGRRPDASRRCVREVLGRLRERVPNGELTLRTDEKSSYATLIRSLFGERARHETISGRLARTSRNPLFPINVTIAMTRDNCGRLRRRSWLVTKNRDRLRDHLAVFAVYRNYIRRRFNSDRPHASAAFVLGLLPRAMTWDEALRWRQDWAQHSPDPMSAQGRTTIADRLAAAA